MKALVAPFILTLTLIAGCAHRDIIVVKGDQTARLSGEIKLPSKPKAKCDGYWLLDGDEWTCKALASAVPAQSLTPMQRWLLNPYGSAYGGYTNGYIRGCTRSVCFGSSWAW